MNTKITKNVKISQEAHSKVTEMRVAMMGVPRERIMELAVDQMYDYIKGHGAHAYLQMREGMKSPGSDSSVDHKDISDV